tara:strand:+ start:5195 stop:6031 length:837 start_codon:yes stop_codon:yes gene_type:complete
MSKLPVFPLIFTDLDGTLLDHHSYTAKPADRLIQRLLDSAIADIIPITSKTRSELRQLEQSIPISHAISVAENGSVIHAPNGYPFRQDDRPHTIILGLTYEAILDQIKALPSHIRQLITGFSDMSATEVAAATGLTLEDAGRAKEREATEPFLWSGSEAEYAELTTFMAPAKIQIQRGGRFYHFTGYTNKEQAMTKIMNAFVDHKPQYEFVSIALGDGPNDLAMIEAADFGVIMPNPEGVTIESTKSHVRTAPIPGPQGWVVAVQEILAELGLILPAS